MGYTIYHLSAYEKEDREREELISKTVEVRGRVSKEYINHLLMKKERHIPLSNAEQELLSLLPDKQDKQYKITNPKVGMKIWDCCNPGFGEGIIGLLNVIDTPFNPLITVVWSVYEFETKHYYPYLGLYEVR